MDTKRYPPNGDDIRRSWDESRPRKRVKREWSEADESTLEKLNRPVVNQRGIYPQRLEEGTTRILVLHPGSKSDDIKCHLRQRISLTQACSDKVLSYDALSYVWGEQENPEFIVLCESRFAVTRNLAEVLRHLRSPTSDRMLWVDAICINQCDKTEIEVQVRSMHYIYKFAKNVIAWLGPADEDSRFAYWTMNSLQELSQSGTIVSAVMACQLGIGETQNGQDSFRKLMDRPYWSRAWIVQEIMFARSLLIQCGSEVVPYSILQKIYPRGMPGSMTISSEDITSTRTHFLGDPEVRLLELDSETISSKRFLDCFLNRQCLKRHDNIFAFLNLLSDDIRQQIPICYDTDKRQLVYNIVRVIIESTQSLYIIIIRGRQTPPHAQGDDGWQLDMPSWCPYLGTPYECCSIEPQDQPSLFAEKAVVSFVTGKEKLQVRGFVIGKVSQTISRHKKSRVGATSWWDQADIDRERKHYWKCLHLGLKGMPKDGHTMFMSIQATTQTLFGGQGAGISDHQTLIEHGIKEELALRKIWHIVNSRLVCSFRLGRAAKRALYSSKAAPAAWINRIALVPRTVLPGDVICTILGCPTPVVLRRKGKRYSVLGEAYVDTSAMGRFKVVVGLKDFILG